MTDQQYTPTKGYLKKAWDWYRADQDKQSGIEPNFRTYRLEFLRAWDAIEAAAEQRGAVKALREAAKDWRWSSWADAPRNPIAAANYTGDWIENRADLLEGDDDH